LRNVSVVGRAAAMAAVLLGAVAVVVLVLGGGGGSYTVHARFQNASQLVKGNLVQVSGKEVGKVEEISITDDGQADLKLRIDEDYAPLHTDTHATVRASSLSGIANRYIDLQLGGAGRKIPDGGVLEQTNTVTAVDLDQLFNTFDPQTRDDLRRLIRGFAQSYAGQGEAANPGWLYVNPSLSAASRFFGELNRDTDLFQRFIVASSKLVTDVADRRDDLAGLITNLADTTNAIGRRNVELAQAVKTLPEFMRRANSAFVNLRSTLDDLDPLVDESKPVAKKLRPFLAELRPLARDARPTIKQLATLMKKSGKNNDLIELTRGTVPFADIAVRDGERNGAQREGSFPASTKALRGATPLLNFARPYAVDLTGWFDDYSHSGVYDALGGSSRVSLNANAFTLVGNVLTPIPIDLRDDVYAATLGSAGLGTLGQRQRCPGSMERGAVWKPSPDYNCDETEVPPGS
jgi:phospholipid/cholesterol/gamma-HCH transport system substrate-binding protein